jgi:hypothetical protein
MDTMSTALDSQVTYRAAWVPDDDPERQWDDAAALALDWLGRQAADLGGEVVLVTHAFENAHAGGSLRRFVRGRTHFTVRSAQGGQRGPVLAYVPTLQALRVAMSRARGSALCVVECVGTPMRGWAAVARALNLITGQTETLNSRLREHLENLKFYGNNGYGNDFDRRGARRILNDIRAAGLLDRDLIIGALAAAGISVHGQEEIAKLVDGRRR